MEKWAALINMLFTIWIISHMIRSDQARKKLQDEILKLSRRIEALEAKLQKENLNTYPSFSDEP